MQDRGIRQHLSIKAKGLLIVVISTVTPILLFIYVLNYQVVSANRESAFQNIRNTNDILSATLEEQADSIYRYSVILLRDPNVRYLVQDIQKEPPKGPYLSQKTSAATLVSTLASSDFIDRIVFYIDDQYSFLVDNNYFFYLDDIITSDEYSLLTNTPTKGLWIIRAKNGTPDFHYLVKVVNPDRYQEIVSVIRITYSSEHLERVMHESLVKHASTFLVNDSGEVLASAGEKTFLEDSFDFSHFPDKCFTPVNIDRTSYWLYRRQLSTFDISLVTLIPASSFGFFATYDAALSRVIAMVTLLWILLFAFSLRHISRITSRIQMITAYVNQRREVSAPIVIPPFSEQDELADLADHFNLLSQELYENMYQIYSLGVEKRSADLKALQAQINPHFLYNTLDMIDFYAYDEKPEVVEEIVAKLARFYKLSLNAGQELHTLMQELDLIHAYFDIQKIRFQNQISLVTDIPEPLLQNQIPPLTLQPLVENSILHGIREKESKTGTVQIIARERKKLLILQVIDDGVGIPDELIDQINGELSRSAYDSGPPSGSHYGIRNINQRIKIIFGSSYGALIIKRESGAETDVILPL